jgi:hypothetical protein
VSRFRGGTVYIGGSFTSVNGQARALVPAIRSGRCRE